jgi:hypothetical protein
MRFHGVVPMLQADEMNRTRQWYGFRCVSAAGDGWCRLVRDDIAIMFMHNDHLGPPHPTATQYIYVDDVMAIWDSIKDRCSAEWGPGKMPYGMLEFAIKDPNSYLLSFGQQLT